MIDNSQLSPTKYNSQHAAVAAASFTSINQPPKSPFLFKLHRVENELMNKNANYQPALALNENFYLKERPVSPEQPFVDFLSGVNTNDQKQNELVLDWLLRKCDTDDAQVTAGRMSASPPSRDFPKKSTDNLRVIRVDKSKSPSIRRAVEPPQRRKWRESDDGDDDDDEDFKSSEIDSELRRTYNEIKRKKSQNVNSNTRIIGQVVEDGESRDLRNLIDDLMRNENIQPDNGECFFLLKVV